MRVFLLFSLFSGLVLSASAQDILQLRNGSVRKGRVVGIDETSFRIGIATPVPGRRATTTVLRSEVEKIEFGPDKVLQAIEKNPSRRMTRSARARWVALSPYLAISASAAGRAGNIFGEILLQSSEEERLAEALIVFQAVESEAWNPVDQARAKRGRLSAMIQLGRSEEVAREVEELVGSEEDEDLLLEGKLVLAQLRLRTLEELLAKNPRWYEDPPVREERNRLFQETADLALYPFLFHGASSNEAADGLWLAHRLYLMVGDDLAAREVATDLLEIYPDTLEAEQAEQALQEKTDEL